jgi:Tol biopolymer transport system component
MSRRRDWVAWTLAAILFVAAIGAWLRPAPAIDRSMDVLSIVPATDTTLTDGEAPQVSPDGRMVAFVASDDSGRTLLYVRDRSSLTARALVGTDDVTQLFWSPDGQSIGFFAGGRLKRIAASGGPAQTLATAPVPRGGTWNREDVILFVPFPEQPPHRIAAAGGTATPLPTTDDHQRWFPSFLPDGRRYLYFGFSSAPTDQGLRVGSLDGTESTELVSSITTGAYVDPGYLLFRREESLVAQRINPERMQLDGTPITLVERVSFNPVTAQAMFSASGNGVLAHMGSGHAWQLTSYDRIGRRMADAGTIEGYNSLCVSADGRRAVYDVADTRSGNVDIWSMNLADGTTTRLTFDPKADFYAACSPSGDEVVFASVRDGTPNLYRLSPSAPGGAQRLFESPMPSLPSQWSRDGRFILFSGYSPATNWDIWVLPLGGGKPVAYLATDAEEKNGQLSPDGRWMAYTAGQEGTYEVYVQPFPATGARWQVSRGGGRQPQWRPDGRQLFYISLDKKLVAVDVDASGSGFVGGSSRVLIDTRVGGWERTHLGNPYAVSADGERFLIANAGDQTLPITMVLNWPSLIASGGK